MAYERYINKILSKFSNRDLKHIGEFDTEVSYEEINKWGWLGAKQKIFSFIAYSEHVDLETIEAYSSATFYYSKKNRLGLPRGFQCGIMSFAVLASRNVDARAIEFVCENKTIHYAASEVPMIYDLESEFLYYPKKFPLYGGLYNDFKESYVNRFK